MAQEPFTATAGDRPVHCPHCDNAWFWHRRTVMSSGSATFFGVDAFSPEAAVLPCTGCGRIELFGTHAVQLFRQRS